MRLVIIQGDLEKFISIILSFCLLILSIILEKE
jgi:hypothetical protein